jgi:5-methylcytosine-specific restriction endonuclease McrA
MPTEDLRDSGRWRAIRKRTRDQATHCELCGCWLDHHANHRTANYPTVDHIRPLHAGGDPYDESNLRVICRSCNCSLGASYGNSLRRPPLPPYGPGPGW